MDRQPGLPSDTRRIDAEIARGADGGAQESHTGAGTIPCRASASVCAQAAHNASSRAQIKEDGKSMRAGYVDMYKSFCASPVRVHARVPGVGGVGQTPPSPAYTRAPCAGELGLCRVYQRSAQEALRRREPRRGGQVGSRGVVEGVEYACCQQPSTPLTRCRRASLHLTPTASSASRRAPTAAAGVRGRPPAPRRRA